MSRRGGNPLAATYHASAAESRKRSDMYEWEPHAPRAPQLRIYATSCCGEYELASEGGEYFVLRPANDGYEETARGRFSRAAQLWNVLTSEHSCADHEEGARQRR
jgi:hypothetical protein